MKRYKYIFFDLFDTLIDFDYAKLPQISIHGEKHNSTSVLVYDVFNKSYPDISFERFYKPFTETYTEFQELKKKEFREYPNQQRWRMLFDKLNLDHNDDEKNLMNEMTEAHMAGLASATTFSEANRQTLNYLQNKGYIFAMISNFDYAPTAYDLIDKYDLRHYFEKIYISIEVGWRKPNKNIFQAALNGCDINSDEVIHVGDNFGADIVGAYDLRIDSIWLNRKEEELNHEYASPNFIIFKLPEITSLF